jgi:hypothetical protein
MLPPQAVLALVVLKLPLLLLALFLQQVHWFRKYKGFTLEVPLGVTFHLGVAMMLAPVEQVFLAAVVVEEECLGEKEALLLGQDLMAQLQT